jgi:hypothetical protein
MAIDGKGKQNLMAPKEKGQQPLAIIEHANKRCLLFLTGRRFPRYLAAPANML